MGSLLSIFVVCSVFVSVFFLLIYIIGNIFFRFRILSLWLKSSFWHADDLRVFIMKGIANKCIVTGGVQPSLA